MRNNPKVIAASAPKGGINLQQTNVDPKISKHDTTISGKCNHDSVIEGNESVIGYLYDGRWLPY